MQIFLVYNNPNCVYQFILWEELLIILFILVLNLIIPLLFICNRKKSYVKDKPHVFMKASI